MSIYYLVIPKNDSNTSGKNLSLSCFGDQAVTLENLKPLIFNKKTGVQHNHIQFYEKVPVNAVDQKEFTANNHILKIEIEQDKDEKLFIRRESTKYRNGSLKMDLEREDVITQPGYRYPQEPITIKIVSQIMPNGNEMTKQDVMRSIEKEVATKLELDDKKSKQHPVLKMADTIKNVISREKPGKENIEKPRSNKM